MSEIQNNDLFDKIITVDFIIGEQKGNPSTGNTTDTFDISERVQTPMTGRKQMISIQGSFWGSGTITNGVLKITNFYTSKPLSDYKAVRVTAGYKNGNQATIYGTIQNSYIENPPPDSITTFELLQGNLLEWSTFWFNRSYQKGDMMQHVFQDLATTLNLNLNWYVKTQFLLDRNVDFNCLCQDVILFKLKKSTPSLVVRIEYNQMYVYEDNIGTGIIYNLDYINSAKKDAAGFNITAPWNPAIRPGDIVKLNPLYYKQSFGGQNIATNEFLVSYITFNFDTNKTNQMNLISYSGAS